MNAPTPDTTTDTDEVAPAVTLSEEQLNVGAEWVVAGHVRLRRRIVSETRMVEVTVRREELLVETDAAVSADGVIAGVTSVSSPSTAPVSPQAPMVFVLSEEVPEIVTRIRPYEKVTAYFDIVQSEQQVSDRIRAEVADLAVAQPVTAAGQP